MHFKQLHNNQSRNHNESKSGFVILIAVLVASLMISLGAFIASIAVKELSLSASGRDSHLAFYAADAAIECALYQDLHVQTFAASSSAIGPATINCNSSSTAIVFRSGLSDADTGVSEFDVSFPESAIADPEFSPYAIVRITKDQIGTINDETTIESRGYNVKSTDVARRVERALEVTY